MLLWDWASVPPFDFMPNPQVEWDTGNKLPLACDVIFQPLHLFIPLYTDLYFYRSIYFVCMCIHTRGHTHWFCILRRIDQLCSNGAFLPWACQQTSGQAWGRSKCWQEFPIDSFQLVFTLPQTSFHSVKSHCIYYCPILRWTHYHCNTLYLGNS